MEELKDMLFFFGYAKHASDPENFTGFFQYAPEAEQEQAQNYKAHVQLTNQVLEWTATLSPEILSEFQYQLSDKSKEVNILDFKTSADAGKAINDWSEKLLYGRSYTNCK